MYILWLLSFINLIYSKLELSINIDNKANKTEWFDIYGNDQLNRSIHIQHTLNIECSLTPRDNSTYFNLFLVTLNDFNHCQRSDIMRRIKRYRITRKLRRLLRRKLLKKYLKKKRSRREIIDSNKLIGSRLLLSCTPNSPHQKRTILVQSLVDAPGTVFFQQNQQYYITSTSDGTMSSYYKNKNGLCQSNKLKWTIDTSKPKRVEVITEKTIEKNQKGGYNWRRYIDDYYTSFKKKKNNLVRYYPRSAQFHQSNNVDSTHKTQWTYFLYRIVIFCFFFIYLPF
ncbi:hypothetical protein SNEBB_004917 [Seison nebaliae]|nr:hypothetical protein SNEBB_004917 [Seison nebaliae]